MYHTYLMVHDRGAAFLRLLEYAVPIGGLPVHLAAWSVCFCIADHIAERLDKQVIISQMWPRTRHFWQPRVF